MTDVPFPMTNQPGAVPGEGLGRLLNRFAELDGQIQQWRLVPGLAAFTDVLVAGPRGMHDFNGLLYDARQNVAATVTANGAVAAVPGTLNGTKPVSWAHNNKSPSNDLIVVSQEAGALYVDPTTGVHPYSGYDGGALPASVNSCAMLDGYFLFTDSSGKVWASGVNSIFVNGVDTTQNPLAYGIADMSGGLVRGTVWAEQYFAWGQRACTVYVNAATSPFPLSRTAIIPVGLLTFGAITGFEPHWGLQQFFVADDHTVRRLDGYTPTVISVNDLERLIQAVVDPTQIEMFCYVTGARPTVVVKGPTFCWEFNALTGNWNERQSPNLSTWRASKSIAFNGQWYCGDTQSTQLLRISLTEYDELGTSFTARMESGAVKNYPNRGRCLSLFVDFTTGQAPSSGNPDAVNPMVSISASVDGGATWTAPVLRRSIGPQGDYREIVRVNRLGGVFSQHGIRFRVDSSSPVYSTCRGARCNVLWLAPA